MGDKKQSSHALKGIVLSLQNIDIMTVTGERDLLMAFYTCLHVGFFTLKLTMLRHTMAIKTTKNASRFVRNPSASFPGCVRRRFHSASAAKKEPADCLICATGRKTLCIWNQCATRYLSAGGVKGLRPTAVCSAHWSVVAPLLWQCPLHLLKTVHPPFSTMHFMYAGWP